MMFKVLTVIAALSGSLVGCASAPSRSLDAVVNTFGNARPQAVQIQFDKNDVKQAYFAETLQQALSEQGITISDTAKMRVLMQMSVDNGKEVMYSSPVFGQTGVASVSRIGNTSYVNPSYGIAGHRTDSATVYTRKVTLSLQDDGREVLRQELISHGSAPTVEQVFPHLSRLLAYDLKTNTRQGSKSYSANCYDKGSAPSSGTFFALGDEDCLIKLAK